MTNKLTNLRRHTYLKENEKKVASLKIAALQQRQPQIDIDLIDKVFAPFSQRLAAANFDQENPEEVTDAVVNLTVGIYIDLINNFIPIHQNALAREFAQELMNQMADQLSEGLDAIYAAKHS